MSNHAGKPIMQYGLSEVYSPTNPQVDIVFVHGLNGHPHRTWSTTKPEVFWPRDLLPSTLAQHECRILTYGYDATVQAFTDGATKDKVHNHAEQLASRLVANRALKKALERPIVFVCHSLGGIIVKRCLIYSESVTHRGIERLRSIYVSTYAILFLGTPQHGSDIELAKTLQSMCEAVLPNKFLEASPHLIPFLTTNNETIQNINRLFMSHIDRFSIFFFYESKLMDLKGRRQFVVGMDLAAPLIEGVEMMGIERDHNNMCKFENEATPGYDVIATAIQRCSSDAPEIIKERWKQETQKRNLERENETQELLGQSNVLDSSSVRPQIDSTPAESLTSQLLVAPLGFRPNAIFYGFDLELDQLHLKLNNSKRLAMGTSAVLIYGPPGCGKTHLAREYVWRHRSEYRDGIYWVDCKTPESRTQGFWDIWRASGMDDRSKDLHGDQSSKFVDEARKWLESRKEWLLVFDEVSFDQEEDIHDFIKFIPDAQDNHIIYTSVDRTLTSRNSLLHPSSVKVGRLTVEEGMKLLYKTLHLNNPTSLQAEKASQLVKHYEGLPLAIHAAAHTLIARGRGLETYSPGASDKRLTAPYIEIMDALRVNGHAEAITLITLLSFFNHTIPLAIIQFGSSALAEFGLEVCAISLSDESKSLDNTIFTLVKYGLLERTLLSYSTDVSKKGKSTSPIEVHTQPQTAVDLEALSSTPDNLSDHSSIETRTLSIDVLRTHALLQDFLLGNLRSRLEDGAGGYRWWLLVASKFLCESYEVAIKQIQASSQVGLVQDFLEFETQTKRLWSHFPKTANDASGSLRRARDDLQEVIRLLRIQRENSHTFSPLKVSNPEPMESVFDRELSDDSDWVLEDPESLKDEDTVVLYPERTEIVSQKASTDEGYYTGTNRSSDPVKGLADDGADETETIYSEKSDVPGSEKDIYLSELARDLYDKIFPVKPEEHVLETLSKVLKDQLKAFALRVGHNAPTQMHRDVMVFIHRNRREIAEHFEQNHSQLDESLQNISKDRSENMDLDERMKLWETSLEDSANEWDDGNPIEDLDQSDRFMNQNSDEDIMSLAVYREFIFNCPAYEWLILNLRKEVLLTHSEPNHMGSIREIITESLPSTRKISRKKSPESYKMTFEVDWDPLAFLEKQMYDISPPEALERSITLTGSIQSSQALPCTAYLSQTWPLTGEYTMRLVKDAVLSGPGRQHSYTLPDNTNLSAWFRQSKLMIEVVGTHSSITEIGEQLGWLGSAIRTSGTELGIVSCYPVIQVYQEPITDSKSEPFLENRCRITFHSQEMAKSAETTNGQCWHNMFRHPVVVHGYPIPRRTEFDSGLELPLSMMAGLARTRYINTFENKLVIKGFSTMLFPTRRSGDVLIWHLLYNEDGGHISYQNLSSYHVEAVSIQDLENLRHVVGWCAEAKYFAGAPDANYSIARSNLRKVHEHCSLKNIILTRGQIVTGGPSFIIGQKDYPDHVFKDPYPEKIKWIDQQYVVLWDEDDVRGWLVNGTSALLHLLRASLEHNRTDKFNSAFVLDLSMLKEADKPHTAESACRVLSNPDNWDLVIYRGRKQDDYVYLADRIEQIYNILEKIIDHQIGVAGHNGVNLKTVPRRYLEGWDFMDLATGTDHILPRVARVRKKGKGWVDFTRSIHAITLFGRGFGDILQRADKRLCDHWTTIPTKSFYLTASTYDLREIMHRYGDQNTNPMKISEDLRWHISDTLFECQCESSGKSSDPVQVLLPRSFLNIPRRHPVRLENHGAVVFGHNRYLKWSWKDIGDPKEEDSLSSSSEESEAEFHDSGIERSIGSPIVNDSDYLTIPSTTALTREDYRVGIICALHKELLAVRLLFDDRHRDLEVPSRDTNHYSLGRIGQHNVVAACQPSGEYGTNSAADVVAHMTRSFPVQFCLLVGIGAGVPSEENDIRLGDVVVCWPTDSEPGVIQYDLVKVLEDGVLERTGSLQRPPRRLMTAISSLRSDPDLSPTPLQEYIEVISSRRMEYKYPTLYTDELFSADYVHDRIQKTCAYCDGPKIERIKRQSNHPIIHYGLIASGNQVIKNAHVRDTIGSRHKILCFEMEAAGVMNTIPCLVIRGICDYADSHKNNSWQEYASSTAAAYAKLLLSVARV